MTLQAENLSFSYGSRKALARVSLILEPGVTALVGPNAAGKSTLLKCLSGLLTPVGQVILKGRDLSTLSRREVSKSISYLPQTDFQRGRFTVFETVLLGRLHDLSWRVSSTDIDRVERLLEEMALSSLSDRMLYELSGGQTQMVALAQAMIREPDVLLLDEPTSNLDLRHQLEVCTRIREITRTRNMITVISIHDLHLAARYGDRVVVLREGEVYGAGSPMQMITPRMMAEVYGVDAVVSWDDAGLSRLVVRGPHAAHPDHRLLKTTFDPSPASR
ncbi:ABC transporter ATP-binding protein [Planctomicrobium sp. SH661]|uniref:ABC transporter ATP-binding protein n=1 Tax=Planctomicrobium sp. SH661 TaxID=3448124 RepID=UPI003F5C6C67